MFTIKASCYHTQVIKNEEVNSPPTFIAYSNRCSSCSFVQMCSNAMVEQLRSGGQRVIQRVHMLQPGIQQSGMWEKRCTVGMDSLRI